VQPVQDDPGAQEQRPLDEGVADHVQCGPGEAERGEQRESRQEHPGVADRGEREQPLDMPLAEAEQRSRDCRHHAERQEDVRDRGPVAGIGNPMCSGVVPRSRSWHAVL